MSDNQSDAAQSYEVIVTPAMLDAGLDMLCDWEGHYYDGPTSAREFVPALYRKMACLQADASFQDVIEEIKFAIRQWYCGKGDLDDLALEVYRLSRSVKS